MYLTHLINSPEARVAFARSEVMEDMLLALKSAKEKIYHFHFPNFSVFYLCRRHLIIDLESQNLPRLPDAIVALASSFKEARSAQL